MARCPECDGTGKVVICRNCDSIIVAGQTHPCCKDPHPGPVEDCEACEGEGTIDDDLDDDECPDCGELAEDCTCEEEEEEDEENADSEDEDEDDPDSDESDDDE